MKTSNIEVVLQLIKCITDANKDIETIKACNAVNFTQTNHMEGQIRVLYSLSDAIGSRIKETVLEVLEARKSTYIKRLLDEYDVAYDGN